jgi:glycerol-3-phosphate acyltransferase PlsY
MFLVFLFLSYIVGSIPFGYIISRIKHVEIRKVGSGNIGATNISRSLGLKYAILVGFLDVLKGALPVFFISQFFSNEILIAFVAIATVLGNIFPIFLKFKGGKGVSTYGGTILIILGLKLFLIVFVIWLTYLYISRLMSLVNLTISLILPAFFLFMIHSGTFFMYSLAAAALIWYTHRENIKRLTSGTERKLTFRH